LSSIEPTAFVLSIAQAIVLGLTLQALVVEVVFCLLLGIAEADELWAGMGCTVVIVGVNTREFWAEGIGREA